MESQVKKEHYQTFIERAFKAETADNHECRYFVDLQSMDENSPLFRTHFKQVQKRIAEAVNRLLSSLPIQQEKADLTVMKRKLFEATTISELNTLLDFGVNRTFRFGLLPRLFT
ncbi:MAG: hypothetical protein JWN56_1217 [Sphingobacteriales bacterium]|nr:hypothetical protein [Sphingobacteriales bacterium]